MCSGAPAWGTNPAWSFCPMSDTELMDSVPAPKLMDVNRASFSCPAHNAKQSICAGGGVYEENIIPCRIGDGGICWIVLPELGGCCANAPWPANVKTARNNIFFKDALPHAFSCILACARQEILARLSSISLGAGTESISSVSNIGQ